MPQIFDIIVNENECYKRYELELKSSPVGMSRTCAAITQTLFQLSKLQNYHIHFISNNFHIKYEINTKSL